MYSVNSEKNQELRDIEAIIISIIIVNAKILRTKGGVMKMFGAVALSTSIVTKAY
ncbi:hypothetical protein FACS1894202_01070 [Clostridia bacterium]|nr:hypothetical protein FACS1894202_01070 [Clostridia bacterium]